VPRTQYYSIRENNIEVEQADTLFTAAFFWKERPTHRAVYLMNMSPAKDGCNDRMVKQLSEMFLREILKRAAVTDRPYG
jgi:hypothetical protein